MRRRRAFTLMELIVAMGLLAALGSLLMMLVFEFSQLGRRQAQSVELSHMSFKLAEIVREDVREAQEVKALGGELGVVTREGARVDYGVENGMLWRRSTEGERAGQKIELARAGGVTWTVEGRGRLLKGELVLTTEGRGKVSMTFPFTIEAYVGREEP